MTLFSTGRHELFFRQFGAPGRPLMVLLHGLYSDSSGCIVLAERFADRFFVVAPDALGHGRSARPERFTLADQGAAISEFTASFGQGRQAVVVGISMGSYIAAQAAITRRDCLTHLVLVAPKSHGLASSTVEYARRHGIDLEQLPPDERAAALSEAIFAPSTPAEMRAAILSTRPAEAVELDQAARAAVDRSLAGFDLRPDLPRITASTLVLSGAADGLNPPAAGRELAELIPHARHVVYEKSGHLLPLEETDRFIADVTEFALGSS